MSREVVYGRNPVRELLRAGRRAAHEVWAVADLAEATWLAGVDVRVRSRAAIGRAAGSSAHQGVIAFCAPYPYVQPTELLDQPGPLVCLDGAHDPRNIGAIARVLDGAGGRALALPVRGSPAVTPAVAKASAGAIEHLRVARVESVPGFLAQARDAGRLVVGASATGGQDPRAVSWPPDPVLVLGAEGTGLRPRVAAGCSRLVTIPLRGHVDSLNISVAAGVLLFVAIVATDYR